MKKYEKPKIENVSLSLHDILMVSMVDSIYDPNEEKGVFDEVWK